MKTKHTPGSSWAVAVVLLMIVSTSCQDPSSQSIDPRAAISAGAMLYQSEGCANCHGARGSGDIGPDLSGVMSTFPVCDDQVDWVSLGSARWTRERGSSYGDVNKRVRGGMPGFGNRLESDQIREIVSFTRAEFAGGDADRVVEDCLG